MGGGASKQKKGTAAAEQKEAKAASSSVKANVTGQILRQDFNEVYEINARKEALGTGMTGAVREWRHRITKQPVAIKSVKKRGMRPAAIEDMKREIRLLSQLDHPNIVKILEAFEDDKCITLVMEICNGGELFDNLIAEQTYTQQRAAGLFKQMVEAVLYCHKMNVTHRDLKLENFVFETREKDSQLKLIDFGLSKRYSGGGIKRMKTMVGTSYYMAPEVLNEYISYTNKCDVWSLGVIMFMMLTGMPPFGGNGEKDIMDAVARNDIAFYEEDWAQMPEAAALVKSMLVVDPTLRFSCQQVLASEWIQKFSQSDGVHQMISTDVIKSMTKYADMEKLKKTAVQVVAFTLPPAEIKKLRDQFKAFDADGSGTLCLPEFRQAMEKHDGMDAQHIADLFSKIDSDHTGLISYSEFISASLSTSVHLNEERLAAAFDKLDPDKSGFIDAQELRHLLKGTVEKSDIDQMIADADAEGENDGKISRDEFIRLVSGHDDVENKK